MGVAGLALLGLLAGAALADPAGSSQGGFQDPASPVAREISNLFWLITAIAFVVGAVVEALLLIAIRKFNAERAASGEDTAEEHAPRMKPGRDPRLHRVEHGSAKLELGIFLGTAAAFAAIVVVSLNSLWAIEYAPDDPSAITVEVIGSQWAWEFRYPAYGITELSGLSEMHVPVNTVVRLNITARDVLHAVWIPDLGVKLDAVPGRVNHFWFNAEQEGRFLLQCAEFCGGAHSDMHASVVVESRAAFDAWVDNKQNPPPPPPPPIFGGETVNVTLTEYALAFSRPLNIQRGSTVTFRITNAGAVDHALHFEAPVNEMSPLVGPGNTTLWNVTFNAVATNAVVMCPVSGHGALGMTALYNVSEGARVVDVYLRDAGVPGQTYSIEPAVIDVTPGERVAFRVHNEGAVAHNLKLGEPYNVVSATINGGETTLMPPITVADVSDSYWCDIPGHRQLGMVGEFSGAQTGPTGPEVPGFEAAWALPALAAVGVALAWRRKKA